MNGKNVVMTASALALLLVFAGSRVAEAGFQEGVAAYEAGNYTTAFNEWLPLAKANDPAAMRNIGHMYRRGLGVPQDYKKALTWYMRAATLGFDRAEANVAGMYLNGEGVKQNYAQAAQWFARAAQQGHVISQYNLGLMLENGLGVKKNEKAALQWFRLAAKAGHPESIKKVKVLEARLKAEGTTETAAAAKSSDAAEAKSEETANAASESPSGNVPTKIIPAGTAASDTVKTQSEMPEKAAQITNDAAEKTASASSEMGEVSMATETEKSAKESTNEPADKKEPIKKKSFFEALKSLVLTTTPADSSEKAATAAAPSSAGQNPPKAMSGTKSMEPETATALAAPSSPATASAPAAETVAESAPKITTASTGTAATPPSSSSSSMSASATGDGLSTAEKLEMAELSYTLKEYQQSLAIWARLAEEGNAEAQYRLGTLFEAGHAVPIDRVRAYYWWQKAKAGGSKDAALALATLEKNLTDAEKRQIDRLN